LHGRHFFFRVIPGSQARYVEGTAFREEAGMNTPYGLEIVDN
jgi:hypothetical protein